MKKRSGFTLMELVVVIAIIAVLGLLLYPQVNNYLESSRKVVCDRNRQTLINDFHFDQLKNKELTLSQYISDLTEKEQCPSKGIYSASDDKHIQCSKHDLIDSNNDQHYIADILVSPTKTWGDLLKEVEEKGGVSLSPAGAVMIEDGIIYVVSDQGAWISAWTLKQYPTLAEYSAANPSAAVKVSGKVFTESDIIFDSYENRNRWSNDNYPIMGDILVYNNELYLAMYTSGINTIIIPDDSKVWIKLLSE